MMIVPTDPLLEARSRTFSLSSFVFDGHATIPEGDENGRHQNM
jgi:hypothetical protein